MKRFIVIVVGLVFGLLAAHPASAQKRKLTDGELDKVTAGGVTTESAGDVLKFQFQGQAGSSHTVDGGGSIAVKIDGLPLNSATLILQDSAQQNLRSLINIIAVNSKIQVLVNLNINIHSTVGAVDQRNAFLGH